MFPDNCASQFTNVLKETIKLDPDVGFEARLANFHIPNVEYVLKADDFDTSSLIYNVGLFEYDTNREAYFQNPNYARELFRLAPDKNIEGLFEKSSCKSSYDISNPENNTGMDMLGKPYGRMQKEKFLFNLNRSLKLSRTEADKYNRVKNTKFESSAKTHFLVIIWGLHLTSLPRGTGVPATPRALGFDFLYLLYR